ncbi:ABC transporter ATP-binding protein [Desulfurispira natronophila]|uniref:Iron complex transport system ATP-binding protein n=1 Tax=Desulfurispira natronophila TaxID=682562 RepID=A0A7W7Y4G3_9BACT|nr:ABC transporter ATP-binding protein [Desulfurispira natronophila]MBB5021928.1 iron complex transport system ATP-binding protein [Desulfurispira natronophila]
MKLQIKGLDFHYQQHTVLQQVDLQLKQGELMAVLGPNGVGKTTLLRCINAMHRPKCGMITLEDADVLRMSSRDIARHFGYVAQRGESARMTAFDAVLLGRSPHMGWRPASKDLQKVEAALRHIGLGKLSLRYIDEMSGGELQKVCIARALVQEPHILLLDEPTSSLDLKNQFDILQTIRTITRSHPVSAIMTMHDLNNALRFADRFVFVKDGRVYADVRACDVSPAIVQAVYDVEVDILEHDGMRLIVPRGSTSL